MFFDSRNPAPLKTLGSFKKDGSYELITPATPRPWQNLLSNDEYLLSISQIGTGFSTYKGIFANRVTRSYMEQEFDDKRTGRFFYLRDEQGDVWSPMVYPVHTSLETYHGYRCRFEPGVMTWEVGRGDITASLQIIVCAAENTELHLLTLRNTSSHERTFDVFFYLEWCFSGAPEDQGFAIDTGFNPELHTLWANVRTQPARRFHQTGFITTNMPILDYDCRRLSFEGPLGTINHPEGVYRGHLNNSGGPRIGSTTGAVRVRITIPPQGEMATLFAMGVCADQSAITNRAKRFAQTAYASALFNTELESVRRYNRAIIERQQMSGGNWPGDLAVFTDQWLKFQMLQNSRWTRWGAKKGYRDVLQDSAGMRLLDPARARNMIQRAISHQRDDGHAPRQWDETPWRSHSWINARDCPYWLIYAVSAYLKETGDFALLTEEYPFINQKGQEAGSATTWDHLLRVVEFLWKERGVHGFCLFGECDWNDSLNMAGILGKGESVWLTQAFAHGLMLMEKLSEHAARLGLSMPRPGFAARFADLVNALNTHGWDGRWYRRGTTDSGRLIGSASCDEGGQIYLLPQAWAVISGTGTPERNASARAAVRERLESENGPMLYTPSYRSYDAEIGRLSVGGSETDSVYVHAALFNIQADLMRGDADSAWDTICKVVPASGFIPCTQSGAEPFCCVNAFAGKSWPWPGWSYVGWWSATPSWLLQCMVEWIFGARAEFGGLRIAPCLPTSWGNAAIIRHFRGATYRLSIVKKEGVPCRSVAITVDGIPVSPALTGTIVPPAPHGATVDIACTVT